MNPDRDQMETENPMKEAVPQTTSITAEPAMPQAASTSPARAVPPDNRILYFGRDRQAFGFLSHFHPAPFVLDGETWADVEHYYQAQKSLDPAFRQAVREAPTPGDAKRLAAHPLAPGKQAKKSWFRNHDSLPRPDWHEVKLDLMRGADWAKFSQNPDLARLLLETGDAELIEDSPFEPFWGVGPDGAGQNWAGRVLMEVRARLRMSLHRPCGSDVGAPS